ncbi:response regulator [Spirosoma sp.]|uniref:response regulator n=1 Tax=Spirosoma sp. TaxID=1899569 RepID=UPI003B3A0497
MSAKASLQILVIDDEPPVTDLLQRLGKQVFPEATFISVDSPQQALNYLQDKQKPQPQLILLDIDLHQAINGIELLPQIRQVLQTVVPIVMFTVSDAQPDVDQAYAVGATAYTKKPDDLEGWRHYVEVLRSYWFRTHFLPGTPSA